MWHVNPVVVEEGVEVVDTKIEAAAKPPTSGGTGRDFAEATATQSHNLMATAATRVWEELYITKKPAIEEVSDTYYLLCLRMYLLGSLSGYIYKNKYMWCIAVMNIYVVYSSKKYLMLCNVLKC